MHFRGIIAALVLLPLIFVWQQRKSESPESPVVRSATHLVRLNVIVDDKTGHPVSNLTQEDFTVTDRGQPQKIGFFSMDSATTTTQPRAPLPQNTFSDEPRYHSGSPNGVTIVLLDNLNTLTGTAPDPYETAPFWIEDHALSNAKQHLMEYLKQLGPSQRIAIYGLSRTLHVLCDFTCDRDQLLAVVGKYDASSHTLRDSAESGNFHPPDATPGFEASLAEEAQGFAAISNQARAETTMAALTAIASHVADIPGRKNLLWLTSNLPFSGEAIARILARANIAAYPLDARGLLPRSPQEDPSGVMDADAYALGELGAPPAMSSQPIGIKALQDMAADTGGLAFVNTNDLTAAIRRAVDDSAVTYTIGFYVDPSSLDGKFHALKVQVKSPGVTVRYPRGYFAFKDEPASNDQRRDTFLAAIRNPLEASAIPLEVRVDRAEQPSPHSLRILGLVGLKGLQLVEEGGFRRGIMDVYVIEQNTAGNVLHQTSNRMRLSLTDQQYQIYLQSGIEFRESLQPAKGAAVLRVLVQDDATSEVGSIIVPLSHLN
jgi:VWFA-related protein